MRFLFLAALVSLAGCSAKSPKPYVPTYTPVPAGDPVGAAVTQDVDSAGGTVSSADGRLVVIIPAGALATTTTISIQPITNTAPNGVGDGYRLGPEGTTFASPVTLEFHLNDLEAQQISGSRIVTQHDDGLWYQQLNAVSDATAGTVSVTTTHFSDWAILQSLLLMPPSSRVHVTSDVTLTAIVIGVDPGGGSGSDELASPNATPLLISQVDGGDHMWAVNGGPTGAAPGLVQEKLVNGDEITGDYLAPDTVPAPTTVTVSLEVSMNHHQVIAVATVDIYAQELWTGTSSITQVDGTKVDASFTMVQPASDTGPVESLVVQSGSVTITPPATTGNNCTLDVSPVTMTIAPDDGMMTVDTTSGVNTPTVSGMGTTVWSATYTTTCPGQAPYSMQSAVQAEWWPFDPGGSPPTAVAIGGKATITISTPLASGTVQVTQGE